jgi:hypothetical protein
VRVGAAVRLTCVNRNIATCHMTAMFLS